MFDPTYGSGTFFVNEYDVLVSLHVNLPKEVLDALGPEPEHEILASVMLHLVRQGKMTVAKAGGFLGMDRASAVRWYTSQGFPYPELHNDELLSELEHAKLP